MLKTLSKFFPLIDHLYIYQILEYNSWEFLKWFLRNPFKRDLQKKHNLVWTSKAKLLFVLSILGLFPLISVFSPIFLIISQVLIWPLEYYQKQTILKKLAEKLKKLPNLKVVAITGSFGKTSTKDILYTLLWKKFYVVKTPKSFNTSLGIAQTILEDIKNNTQIFICEIGAYKKGEIKKITELINPDIGIITAIAPQHLEKFGSLENIAKAKFELAENVAKDGIVILNGEYQILEDLCVHLRGVRTNFYGWEIDPYYATDIKTAIEGTSFIIHTPKGKAEINIPLIGEHHVQNFLAAAQAALELGLTLSEIKERTTLLLPTPHRLEVKKQGSMTIIDNTYNTNPKAARASLKLLQQMPASQKIIITPGLIELGNQSSKENQSFAQDAAKVVDDFIVVGETFKKDLLLGLRNSSITAGHIYTVGSIQEAINLLPKIAKPDAVVLLENDLPDQYS